MPPFGSHAVSFTAQPSLICRRENGGYQQPDRGRTSGFNDVDLLVVSDKAHG